MSCVFLTNDILEIIRENYDNEQLLDFFKGYLSEMKIPIISFDTYNDVLCTSIVLLYNHYLLNEKIINDKGLDSYKRGMDIIAGFSFFALIFPLLDKYIADKSTLMKLYKIFNTTYMTINSQDKININEELQTKMVYELKNELKQLSK